MLLIIKQYSILEIQLHLLNMVSGKGYSERSVKGLKRGTLEKPWGYGEKYHTEGDVGT